MMKRLITLTIAFVLAFGTTAYAAQMAPLEPSEVGKTQAELNGYSEQQWAVLMDDTLEYSEVRDLVHNFNPNMSYAWSSYDKSMRDLKQSANIMASAKKDLKTTYETYKPMAAFLPPGTLEGLEAAMSAAGTMEKTYNNIYNHRDKDSGKNAQIRMGEKQVINGVQQLMIGYKTVEANVETLTTLVRLNEASLKAYENMQKQGMATETDVLNAKASLVSAQGNLENLKGTKQQLYNQLITMCGWKRGDNVVIGDIPAPDMNRIAVMNPEADLYKAAGNNSTIISLRSGRHSKSSDGRAAFEKEENTLLDNLRIQLDKLYGDVIAAKYGYEAAQAGYKGAQITEKATKVQYESGQLSEAQYIGASITAISKKAALNSAKYSLESAIVKYEAALNGMCDIN